LATEVPYAPSAGTCREHPVINPATDHPLELHEPVQSRGLAPRHRSSVAATVTATIAVIAALWWGQRFLIPLTAGVMLAMLVTPLSDVLGRWLRSTVAATVLTLLLVLGALGAGVMAFGNQLLSVADRAPAMITMAAQQLTKGAHGSDSPFARAKDSLQELDRAADQLTAEEPVSARSRRAAAARAVAAAAVPGNSISLGAAAALRNTAMTGSAALLAFAGNISIIFFVAFFVLIGGRPLIERFLSLWSDDPAAKIGATLALQESANQIRLYSGVLLATNAAIGIAVWAAFSLANLPDAAGWGATAAILHVVPYLGVALLTVLGAAETYLAYQSLGAALGMAAYLILLSALIGTLVAAWLQGRAARMSSAALFIGLVFWGALWGVWGLFLGPPLVVLLKVIAGHVHDGRRLSQLMQG
jgi:predicted PurR-regulated permease PerM